MKKWYYVIIERRSRKHCHPSRYKADAQKWAKFYNLESELKNTGVCAWVDSVVLDADDDICAWLRDADEDWYECAMDDYFG